MTFSTPTWGVSLGQFRAVTLHDALETWLKATTPVAQQKGLRLTTSLDSTLPARISIDPDALAIIIGELLSNAIRYTQKGEIGLSLAARGSSIAIIVRDTGIGIPSYLTSSLLSGAMPTRPASHDGATSPMPGLATVRRLSQLLGGSMIIFSQIGEGTTVTVLLPLVAVGEAPARP